MKRGGHRQNEWVARYGGDEFVVVLPETDPAGAVFVAERLRKTVAGSLLMHGITVSAGIAVYPSDGATLEALLSAADQRLYAGKRLGRNRVIRPAQHLQHSQPPHVLMEA